MIQNDKQRELTEAAMNRFDQAVKDTARYIDRLTSEMKLAQVQFDALQSQYETLAKEIDEYDQRGKAQQDSRGTQDDQGPC